MTMVPLGEAFVRITNGKNVRQGEIDGGIPVTRIETISSGVINPEKCGYAALDSPGNEKWMLNVGDILMSHINSPQHVGKCAMYTAGLPEMIHGMNLLRLVPDPARLNSSYALHQLRSTEFRSQLRRFINQAVNQASVSVTNLKSLAFRLPPLDEQRRIAAILDKTDELRDKRREALAHLDATVRSIFIDMFGSPERNAKDFEQVPLESIGTWRSGGTPDRKNRAYFQGNLPWYTSGELEHKFLGQSVAQITEAALAHSSAKEIPVGSLLLGMYDTAALKSGISTIPSSCNQAIAYGVLDPSVAHTEYVYHCIQIGKEHYRRLQRGVRQKNLNLSMVRGIRIPLPPLTHQIQFAARVAAVERLKEHHRTQLAHLDSLFASLQHRAFKGEL